ncbi:DUF6197 family protein [Micromonospora siamensis]|uniref:Uncharacterized protein n=1 Tax=Micromonospora siamensis TaxID=299152 RepID=A0A1C5I638_9ACTN|nr:hypothetical protein [Micromonospora siamensis]SCG53623.1 hypothetical protein GA0074704_2966 [Micromonospora siamensis]
MNPTQKQPDTSAALADLTPADILRCAARYLELRGWTQRVPFDRATDTAFPPACVTAAIGMAVYGDRMPVLRGDDGNSDRTLRYLADYLWRDGSVPPGDYYGALCASDREIVADWNDDATQTLADVLDVLRDAADDYDWTHATEEQLETYAQHEYDNERLPTRAGFLTWRAAR